MLIFSNIVMTVVPRLLVAFSKTLHLLTLSIFHFHFLVLKHSRIKNSTFTFIFETKNTILLQSH